MALESWMNVTALLVIGSIRLFGFSFSRCGRTAKLALTEIKLEFQGWPELDGGSKTLPGFAPEILQGANASFRNQFLQL